MNLPTIMAADPVKLNEKRSCFEKVIMVQIKKVS